VTRDGRIAEFGAGMTSRSRPLSIVVRDGALWFSQADSGRVARMTLDGEVTEFPIPTSDSQPRAMALHPDGSIWFVETGANALGRIAGDGESSSSALRRQTPRPAALRRPPMAISGLLKISLTRSVEWTQPAPWPPNMTSQLPRAVRAASWRCPAAACFSRNMTPA
jgi:hypothetical protein